MTSAQILEFPSPLLRSCEMDYTGLITTHNANGTGTIQLRSPPELRGHTLSYNPSNMNLEVVRSLCRPGMAVEGRARRDFPLPGWNVFTLEPLGGLGEILAPTRPPSLWQRLRILLKF